MSVKVQLYNSDGTVEITPNIDCDNTLDTTSENPVQNKVVANALNNKAGVTIRRFSST